MDVDLSLRRQRASARFKYDERMLAATNPFSREVKYDFRVDLGRTVERFAEYLRSNGW